MEEKQSDSLDNDLSTFQPESFVPTVNFFCQVLENTFAFNSNELHFFESGIAKSHGLYLNDNYCLRFLNSCSTARTADMFNTVTASTAYILLTQKSKEKSMLDLMLNDHMSISQAHPQISKDRLESYFNSVTSLNGFLKEKYLDSNVLMSFLDEDGFSSGLVPSELVAELNKEVAFLKVLMCLVSTQFIYVSSVYLLKRPFLKVFLGVCLTNKKYLLQHIDESLYNSIYAFAKRVYEIKHLVVSLYLKNEAVIKDVVALCEIASKKH